MIVVAAFNKIPDMSPLFITLTTESMLDEHNYTIESDKMMTVGGDTVEITANDLSDYELQDFTGEFCLRGRNMYYLGTCYNAEVYIAIVNSNSQHNCTTSPCTSSVVLPINQSVVTIGIFHKTAFDIESIPVETIDVSSRTSNFRNHTILDNNITSNHWFER